MEVSLKILIVLLGSSHPIRAQIHRRLIIAYDIGVKDFKRWWRCWLFSVELNFNIMIVFLDASMNGSKWIDHVPNIQVIDILASPAYYRMPPSGATWWSILSFGLIKLSLFCLYDCIICKCFGIVFIIKTENCILTPKLHLTEYFRFLTGSCCHPS